MSREKLNAHKWEDILREMHEKPETQPQAPPPAEPTEKDEFARRPFGSVNGYVRRLEIENATLRRRVRVLEELVSKS
jgi:hypothetical protein